MADPPASMTMYYVFIFLNEEKTRTYTGWFISNTRDNVNPN